MAALHPQRRRHWTWVALASLALSGCADLEYYGQAAGGQIDLWRRSHPIEDWLADPGTSDALKARLRLVEQIRVFASEDLDLPDNASYRSYADVERPFLVWNLFAAPPLSTTPKSWCFPVAGCVTYRGYFTEALARSTAQRLSDEGYDTYVGGVPAYSTLGWFSDPLPSTVIGYPKIDLARLVFHELAHQVVYVPGDTSFNESFATAVEREGARRWLLAQGSAPALQSLEQTEFREACFHALVDETRRRLKAVYVGPAADTEKRIAKRRIVSELRSRYAHAGWDPEHRYAAWFAGPLNNAQLAAVASYTQHLQAFDAMLARAQGNLPDFYAEVRKLSRLPRHERDRELDTIAYQPTGPALARGDIAPCGKVPTTGHSAESTRWAK
jgi:predicted aminopeptidase